jgi:hypothetical protein
MNYTNKATAKTPAHVLFVIDTSASMNERCGDTTRTGVVQKALTEVILQMADLSTKVVNGEAVLRPRFRIAILGYNDRVYSYHRGFVPLDEFVNGGLPAIKPDGGTNTAQALLAAEQLLDEVLLTMQHDWPAPLVCHLTDGEYNQGGSPVAIADRIRSRQTSDGPVLLENVFITDNALRHPPRSWKEWTGVRQESDLRDDYAKLLFRMSSEIPAAYIETIRYWAFDNIGPGARLMFPGTQVDLITKALVTTGSSGGMPGRSISRE